MDQIPVIVHPVEEKEIIEIIETEDTTVLPTLNVITVLNVEDHVHLVIRVIGVIGIGTGIESMRGGGIVNVLLLNNTVIDLVEEGENTRILVGIQDIGVEVGGETIMEEEEGEGMRTEVHLEDTGEMIDDKEVGIEEEEVEVIEEEVGEEEEGEEGEEGMDLLSKDSQIKAIGGIGVLHPKILSSLVNARDLSLHGMSNLTGLRVSLLNKLN